MKFKITKKQLFRYIGVGSISIFLVIIGLWVYKTHEYIISFVEVTNIAPTSFSVVWSSNSAVSLSVTYAKGDKKCIPIIGNMLYAQKRSSNSWVNNVSFGNLQMGEQYSVCMWYLGYPVKRLLVKLPDTDNTHIVSQINTFSGLVYKYRENEDRHVLQDNVLVLINLESYDSNVGNEDNVSIDGQKSQVISAMTNDGGAYSVAVGMLFDDLLNKEYKWNSENMYMKIRIVAHGGYYEQTFPYSSIVNGIVPDIVLRGDDMISIGDSGNNVVYAKTNDCPGGSASACTSICKSGCSGEYKDVCIDGCPAACADLCSNNEGNDNGDTNVSSINDDSIDHGGGSGNTIQWGGAGRYCKGDHLCYCSSPDNCYDCKKCVYGCKQNPPGTADVCKQGNDGDNGKLDECDKCLREAVDDYECYDLCKGDNIMPTSEWGGKGNYCVGDKLCYCDSVNHCYNCKTCDNGCIRNAPGIPDACNSLPGDSLGGGSYFISEDRWRGVGDYCIGNRVLYTCSSRTNCVAIKDCGVGKCVSSSNGDACMDDTAQNITIVPDNRAGCVNAFGMGLCNVPPGGSCVWKGGWNNCAAGYTCKSGVCVEDGTNTYYTYTGSGDPQDIWQQVKSLPEFNGIPLPDEVRIVPGMVGCNAGGWPLVCGEFVNRMNSSDLARLLQHEAMHYVQKVNRASDSSCPAATDGYGSGRCGSRVRETGAERKYNGGCYTFTVVENGQSVVKCGTEIYQEVVAAVGEKTADSFFDADCRVWDTVNRTYNFCNKVVSYVLNCNRNREICHHDEVPIPVNGNTSVSLLEEVWDVIMDKAYADSDDLGIERSGYYKVDVQGKEAVIPVVLAMPGDKAMVFNDKNGDGIRQPDEEIIQDAKLSVEVVSNFVDYDLSNGWNSMSAYMDIVDSNGNKIETLGQLVNMVKREFGVNITNAVVIQDGVWKSIAVTGKTFLGEDIQLKNINGLFVKVNGESNSYPFTLVGTVKEENLLENIHEGFNLISISDIDKYKNAKDLLQVIHDNGYGIAMIMYYNEDKSMYDSLVYDGMHFYGFDFAIVENKAYLFLLKKEE